MRKLLIVLSVVFGIAGCAGTGMMNSSYDNTYGWDRGSLSGSDSGAD